MALRVVSTSVFKQTCKATVCRVLPTAATRSYSRVVNNNNPLIANSTNNRKTTLIHPTSIKAHTRSIFVTVETTPNINSLKFFPGVDVLPKGSMEFPNRRSAVSSPLAKALFAVEGVKLLYFTKNFISVNKDPDMDWEELKPALFSTIIEFYASGKPIVTDEKPRTDTEIQEGDSEVVQAIKEILENRVRPSVQQDGGDIEYRGFEDGVVLLKMQGSCSGCSSSSVTLKSGIERMLMHYVPEVNGVIAISDEELDKVNLEAFNKTEKSESNA